MTGKLELAPVPVEDEEKPISVGSFDESVIGARYVPVIGAPEELTAPTLIAMTADAPLVRPLASVSDSAAAAGVFEAGLDPDETPPPPLLHAATASTAIMVASRRITNGILLETGARDRAP